MPLKIYSACSVLKGSFCVLFPPVFWSKIVRIRTYSADSINEGPCVCFHYIFQLHLKILQKSRTSPKSSRGKSYLKSYLKSHHISLHCVISANLKLPHGVKEIAIISLYESSLVLAFRSIANRISLLQTLWTAWQE